MLITPLIDLRDRFVFEDDLTFIDFHTGERK